MRYLTCLVVIITPQKADGGNVIKPLIRHFHTVNEIYGHPTHERASGNGFLTIGTTALNQKQLNPSCDFCSGSKGCLLVIHTRR